MIKKTFAALLVSCFASAASAEVLTCKQTKLSANGFNKVSDAQSWFPKNMKLDIRGDEVFSNFYGKGTVVDADGRKAIAFVLATSRGDRVVVDITFIERSKRYSARLRGQSGYVQTAGAGGKCKVS